MNNHRALISLGALGLALSCGITQAGVIAEFQADSLTAGASPTPVNSWNDDSSHANYATTGNSGQAAPTVFAAGTTGYTAIGNNHAYVSFNGSGLATSSALFTGNSARTVVVVYQNQNDLSGPAFTNGLAGETGPASTGTWFEVQIGDLTTWIWG